MTNPADLSYLVAMAEEEREYQRMIVRAREYHEGDQPVELTDRMLEFLGLSDSDPSFILNVARLVVMAAAERLKVTGFDSDEEAVVVTTANPDGTTTEDKIKPFAAWAWERWQHNRMDAVQDEVHEGAVRDGEYFLLVDGDDLNKRARFTPHPRYTDPYEANGDGEGIRVFYHNKNRRGPIAYATKHWTEKRIIEDKDKIKSVNVKLLNIYWPDKLERYEWVKGDWQPYTGDDKKPVVPWLDNAGQPLGVPVIPFCNTGDRCEAKDAWPIQDAINKAFVDLVAAEDIAALGILFTFGFFPTTDGAPPREDGGNALLVQAGSFVSTTKGPSDADAKRIQGEDLSQLIQAIQSKIQWLAGVTSTPPARFQITGQIARAETLKEQETPLLAKLAPKQTLFGNAWEDALYMARRIENTFYGGSLPEDIILSTQWAPTATRDEKAEREAILMEKEIGVPFEFLVSRLGYSQWEIAQMKKLKEEAADREMERQRQLATVSPPQALVGRQN